MRPWMQIRADVSGLPLGIMSVPDATLIGAAMVTGIGCGVFPDLNVAFDCLAPRIEVIAPDAERHRQYERLYNPGYITLQTALHEFATRRG